MNKHILLITTIVGFALLAGTAAASPAGDLDPAFDGDGKRPLNWGYDYDAARAVLLLPDGKILLAGYGGDGLDFAVSRLHHDGSLDSSFGDGGTAFADFGGEDQAYGAAVQPDGKIVLAGRTRANGRSWMAVARFTAEGKLDPQFAPNSSYGAGKQAFPDFDAHRVANAVLVEPSGSIVLAGNGYSNESENIALTRLTASGGPDKTYHADFGGTETGNAAALQKDGKIVVTGETSTADGKLKRIVARFEAGGELDETFNGTGKWTFDEDKTAQAHAVLVQPDGRLVVAGFGGPQIDLLVSRLRPGGGHDTTFGSGGTTAVDFEGDDTAVAAALRPDGRVVVAGLTTVDFDIAVAQLLPNGAPDSGFGAGGKSRINFGGFPDAAYAVAVDHQGRAVVAGLTFGSVAVARLQADPPPSSGPGPATPAPPTCDGRPATIVGTPGRDTLRGTRRADVIVALGGADRVLAGGGNDLVCGGAGNDRLEGGAGRDRLLGDAGRDRLTGGRGRDLCVGAAGRDRASACERRRSIG